MTADSIPISELGQAGRWFLAAHVASYKAGIVQLGSDSTIFVFSVHFIVCICVYLSLINEMSHSRHAPLVLQPTSKPGRPHPVIIPYFCQKYSILYAILRLNRFLLRIAWCYNHQGHWHCLVMAFVTHRNPHASRMLDRELLCH